MKKPAGGLFPSDFIQEVLGRTDIVALISEEVPLKPAGSQFKGCCPFHQEKTPSFSVSPTKQFYHCFGCGVSGDAIKFLSERQGLSFVDAVSTLARRANIPIPERTQGQVDGSSQSERDPLYRALERASAFFAHQLKVHKERDMAVEYLKSRGMTGVVAKDFAVGYAPAAWDALYQALKAEGMNDATLVKAGLVLPNKRGGYYDRFRQRIMFPIEDTQGRIVGFGARALTAEQSPKYLNSPETPVFHKSRTLYGLKRAVAKLDKDAPFLVVEGYMDVIALSQCGRPGAVAALGTALTAPHFELLFRYRNQIILCLDGDEAGIKAAQKAMQLLLPLMTDGREIKFLFLPQGDDPDTYIRTHGVQKFNGLVQKALPLSDYFFIALAEQIPLNSLDTKARFAKEGKARLAALPDGDFKKMMSQRLNQLVYAKLNRPLPKWLSTQAVSIPPKVPALVNRAAFLLVNNPALFGRLDRPSLPPVSQKLSMGALVEIVKAIGRSPSITSGELQTVLPKHQWSEMSGQFKDLASLSEGMQLAELNGVWQKLHLQASDLILEELSQVAAERPLTPAERTKLQELLKSRESIDYSPL